MKYYVTSLTCVPTYVSRSLPRNLIRERMSNIERRGDENIEVGEEERKVCCDATDGFIF